MLTWYRHSTFLCQVGVSCPVCVPSQLLVYPQPARWQGRVRSWRVLDLVQVLLCNN